MPDAVRATQLRASVSVRAHGFDRGTRQHPQPEQTTNRATPGPAQPGRDPMRGHHEEKGQA